MDLTEDGIDAIRELSNALREHSAALDGHAAALRESAAESRAERLGEEEELEGLDDG
ncbi:MAG: hypothetical protein JWO82_2492 [Akkermansiaceae bacterium]|nr:hypothetical protein [Akkermansiaceae bacterium]